MIKLLKNIPYVNNNFFTNLFSVITVFVSLTIIVVSILVYFFAKQAIINNIFSSNQNVLSLINESLNITDSNIRSFAVSAYYSKSAGDLFESKNDEYLRINAAINDIDNMRNFSSYIYSIYFSNEYKSNYHIVGDITASGLKNFYDKDYLKQLITIDDSKILKPIPRIIQADLFNKSRLINVYTYFVFERENTASPKRNILAVNVKSDELNRAITSLNKTYIDKKSTTYIINREGLVLADPDKTSFKKNISSEKYIQDILQSKKSLGYFIFKIKGIDTLITYKYNNNLDWYIINTNHLSDALKVISTIRNILIVSCIILLLFMVFVSYIISKKLYSPIKMLTNKIMSQITSMNDNNIEQNEFRFIQNAVSHVVDKIQYAEKEMTRTNQVLKQRFILSLLNNTTNNLSEMLDDFNKFEIDQYGNYNIVVFSIDSYMEYVIKNNNSQRNLYRFAIKNIATELLTSMFICETTDNNEDRIIYIVKRKEEPINQETDFRKIIIKIQDALIKYFGISLTCAISSDFENIMECNNYYIEAIEFLNYRLTEGHKSIITPGTIESRPLMRFKYPVELEKKIIESIRISKHDLTMECFEKFIKHLVNYSYVDIRYSISYLFSSVYREFNSFIDAKNTYFDVDFVSLQNSLNTLETLSEVKSKFSLIFESVTQRTANQNEGKKDKLILIVENKVNLEYSNSNLSQSLIAKDLKMSSVYLGMVFREGTGMSIGEYINEIRLIKAVELLNKTDYTIGEILVKIGWENQKYFFVKFKKKFGLTPSNKRLLGMDTVN